MKQPVFQKWLFLLSGLAFFGSCTSQQPQNLSTIETDILNNTESFFYLDTKNYPTSDKNLPIGIFDSGTGGLTVMDAIVNFDQFNNADHSLSSKGDGQRDFAAERFIYLGDQANMPYGNYSRENKVDLLKEHIFKDVQFLMGNKYYNSASSTQFKEDKDPVKAIVIACNTATAYGKKDIEHFLEEAGIQLKVIGVIGAAVRAAFENLQNPENVSIGIMATAGTVSSDGYVQAIKDFTDKNQMPEVFQQAGIGLAGAIDGDADFISTEAKTPRSGYKGPAVDHPDAQIDLSILGRYNFNWDNNQILFEGDRKNPQKLQINSVPNYINYHLVSLLEKIRKSAHPKPLKSIILGCTHYPFYLDLFKNKLEDLYNYKEGGQFIYRPLMSKEISLIDPARNTARELYTYLEEKNIFNDSRLSESEFYISVPNTSNGQNEYDVPGRFSYAYKYGRTAGSIQQYVKRIPFSEEAVGKSNLDRLDEAIPVTADLIHKFMNFKHSEN